MQTEWILIANTVDAKIYAQKPDDKKSLKLVNELYHLEGAIKSEELSSDRPGHYQTNHATRGSYTEQDLKEIENDKFARRIVSYLIDAKNNNQFQSLIVIAAPHFLGLLKKHFNKPLEKTIQKIIHKNLNRINDKDLVEILMQE